MFQFKHIIFEYKTIEIVAPESTKWRTINFQFALQWYTDVGLSEVTFKSGSTNQCSRPVVLFGSNLWLEKSPLLPWILGHSSFCELFDTFPYEGGFVSEVTNNIKFGLDQNQKIIFIKKCHVFDRTNFFFISCTL